MIKWKNPKIRYNPSKVILYFQVSGVLCGREKFVSGGEV